jgi:hypothetical protein
MKRLIIIVIAMCCMALTTGCSSTGRFNSPDYATRLDSLEQFDTTWETTGQPQCDFIGQSLVTRWEESRDVMFAAIDRSGNLAILNKIALSCEQNFEAEGIENPTDKETQRMINDIVAALTPEEQRYVGEYYATRKKELEQANDDGKEIGLMIQRAIPVFEQFKERLENEEKPANLDLGKTIKWTSRIARELKAVANGLSQVKTLKDWNDNCLEMIDDEKQMAMRLQSASRFNRAQVEDR